MAINAKQIISAHPMFAGLSDNSLRGVVATARIHHFKAGDYLWHAGDPVKSLCLVATGLLQTNILMLSGKNSVIELFRPGDICGCLTYIQKRNALCDLRAVVDSTAVCIPCQKIIFSPEALAQNIAERFERQIHLRTICAEPSPRKIPALLLWLHECTGSSIPLTQSIIAAIIGLSEETVCRALAPLKKNGLVCLSRGFIMIPRPQALEKYLADI
jgi:CRP/FNR family transcriptional regulator